MKIIVLVILSLLVSCGSLIQYKDSILNYKGGVNINFIILIGYILTLSGGYLFLHAEKFKYKFLGFFFTLIGLGIVYIFLTIQMIA